MIEELRIKQFTEKKKELLDIQLKNISMHGGMLFFVSD